MKKVLVIDNYDSFVFNIVQLLREASTVPHFNVVHNDRIPFDRLNEYDGILLSPGPGIPEEAGEMFRLIETCKHSHPILGICLGHQALAQAFGASLYNLPYPLHGHPSALQRVDLHDRLFAGLPDTVVVGRYHSWVVDATTLPDELVVSSVDEQGNVMSFYHCTLPIHGLQFHPESYISDCGQTIVNNWLERY